MGNKYVIGVDFGTTGVKASVFDTDGGMHGSAYYDAPTIYPKPGYAEIDANKVMKCAQDASKTVIESSGINPEDIIGVSFSNICGSIAPIDKDLNFIFPIMPWNDNRGFEVFGELEELMEKDGVTDVEDYRRTGYNLQAICTLPSMYWLKKYHPDIYDKTWKFVSCQAIMHLAFTGTSFADDKAYITFSKMADLSDLTYAQDLCDRYGIEMDKLPDVLDTASLVGYVSEKTAPLTGLAVGTPVFVGAGDVMCATVGAGVFDSKTACVVVGTGGNVNAYSPEPACHPEGKLPVHGSPVIGGYHLMGTCSAAASSLKWYVDNYCQAEEVEAKEMGISVYELMNRYAEEAPVGSNGVMFNTWMMGAACPFFNDNARGTFTGLSLSSTKQEVTRSIMEGVCLELLCILKACEEAKGENFELIRMMGGGSKSKIWRQIMADVCGVPVETTECDEAAALAAAMYAAVGAGEYEDIGSAVNNMVKIKDRIEPNLENHEKYKKLYVVYNKIYEALSAEVFPMLAEINKQ